MEIAGLMSERLKSSSCAEQPYNGLEEEIEALYAHVPEVANHFTITSKIGEGSFSCVYLASLKHYPEVQEMFALKHIIPTTHPSRVENELRCLLNIGGSDNVMGVKLCLRNRDHIVIVMSAFPHDRFQDYLHQMDLSEARDYMKNLLIALRRVHQFNVIHRDVKPSNFLYNRQRKQYALVDFGLSSGSILIDRENEKIGKVLPAPKATLALPTSAPALPTSVLSAENRMPLSPSKNESIMINSANIRKQKKSAAGRRKIPSKLPGSLSSQRDGLCGCFSQPMVCALCVARSNQVAPRAGTAGFRSLEMLMKFPHQTTAVDIWAAGVIFLSILSARYPFFRAQDDTGHLAQIISLLGSQACTEAAAVFDKTLTLGESVTAVDLKTACMKLRLSQMSYKLGPLTHRNRVVQSWLNISDQPFHLLSRMLDPNPVTRITAEQALQHPFFEKSEDG